MFDWNDLRYLLAIARAGSTLAAARALQVSQSTVHRRMVALERELGCSLVERHPTGYRLTDLGRQLRVHAERIEDETLGLRRRVASADHGMSGRVRMTCTTAVGQRVMKSGLFDKFGKLHPALSAELVMTENVLNLSAGEADIAIRGGEPNDEALIGKKIADVPWGIYASHAYVERYGAPKSPQDLGSHRIVRFIDALAGHKAAIWMRSHAPDARISGESGSIPSVLLAVKSGACLAPLPAPLADMDDELRCVLGPIMSYPMYLLTHRELRQVPRIKALFDFCVRELKPVVAGTVKPVVAGTVKPR